MKRLLNTVCLLFLLYSTHNAQINVVPVTDSELQIKENSLLYSLPRVTININVIVETEYYFPGPYQKYADKYLTIKNTKKEASVKSEIKEIEISTLTEPDPNATYLVFLKNKNFFGHELQDNLGYFF